MKKTLQALILYTLLVIVWGAWVRISHSGDGCGASWPLCQNQLIPQSGQTKTWVEYAHRLMSGIYGLLVAGIMLQVLRSKGSGQREKFWAKLTFVFMVTEALLGAKLVLSGLVGVNDTPARSVAMALHFMNSLFLTGSLSLLYLSLLTRDEGRRHPSDISETLKKWMLRLRGVAAVLFYFIGATGTIAALSNTLYPVESLISALAQDLDPNSHYLIRLRGLHPVLGLSLGLSLTLIFFFISEALPRSTPRIRNRSYFLSVLFGVTAILGSLNLIFHSPVFLKLLHLTSVHLLWMGILFFSHACAYGGIREKK